MSKRNTFIAVAFGMLGGVAVSIMSAEAGRNGSGTYSLPAGNPVVTGTVISATTHNNTMTDLAAALTASIAKDGQTVPTANLPMGGFRHTGVGTASARNHYGVASQVQDGAYNLAGSVAGADTITGSLSPAPSAYADGMPVMFVPASANTGAATLNLNGIAARAVVKEGAAALAAGDLATGIPAYVVYNVANTRWNLLNPQTNPIADTTGTLAVNRGGTGATTLTGLLQGNGTSALTAITNSSTVGQILRVTGAATYAWGALDLTDGDAISGDLPDANLSAPLTAIAGLAVTDNNVIVGNGSTWVAESGATARTSLGVAIGSDVQAFDAELGEIAALSDADNNFLVGNGSAWVAESGGTARTSLGAAASATTVSVSGTGLSGGGDLSANRTITIDQTAMTTRNITGKAGTTKTLLAVASCPPASGGVDGQIWYCY